MIINDNVKMDVEELIQQGQVLSGQGLHSEAILYLSKALSLDPTNYEAYMSRGVVWAESGDLEKGKEDFIKASKVDREAPQPYFHLGNIAFLQNDIQEGLKMYNRAIAQGYDDSELYFNLGIVYEEEGEYETAIRNYTHAIHMDELRPEYRIRKATTQLKAGWNEEAIETLDGLYLVAPDSFEFFHLKALAYIAMGKFDEADSVLANALEAFPDDEDLINDRIRTLTTKGDYDAALGYIQQIKPVITDATVRKELLVNEGRLHAAKEEFDKAITSLNEAVAIEDSAVHDSEALYLLINLHAQVKNWDSMIAAAQALQKYQNENAYALSAWYYEAVGKKCRGDADADQTFRKCTKLYRRVAMDDPARIDAYMYRAMCHKDLGEFNKAVELMDYIGLLQPQNAEIHLIKAALYDEMGKPEKVAEEKLLAQNGNSMLIIS